jgi:hypothetical protein
MLERIAKITACSLLVMEVLACGVAGSERRTIVATNSPTPLSSETRTVFHDETVQSLCDRLPEIKRIPYRDPNDTDPVYEAIIAKGWEAGPCLIEKITDETSMPDPREAPPWQHYKVGDTAVFILARLAGNDEEILPKMLPKAYEKEWETNGVYAYFNYVLERENRARLQQWWRDWTAKRKNVK